MTARAQIRLGVADSVPAILTAVVPEAEDGRRSEGPELWLARPNRRASSFRFEETLRADAAATLRRLANAAWDFS